MPSSLAQYPDDFMLFEDQSPTPMPTEPPSVSKVTEVKKSVLDTYNTLISGSITFVASLAWHEAFRSFFGADGPFPFLSKWGPWVYAATITLLGAIMIHMFQHRKERYTKTMSSRY